MASKRKKTFQELVEQELPFARNRISSALTGLNGQSASITVDAIGCVVRAEQAGTFQLGKSRLAEAVALLTALGEHYDLESR